ncbi:hypothetical protein CEN50_18955 [Fischerella thermalis CCMEE 5268]|uniref:Uncharacterized protein n=1 Tax=Fischerella thermalis CCMEE 5268 TaxID=2019662 RepID=A0A2N6KCI3_9CYAN|nr:hypothetical protein [Fischerella thermalis]PLZ96365.1 hypothetical protein CEN50_18955 [Fischerella thermalis CCMEE 5268]
MKTKEKVEFPGLPLAVYREVAAHLRQVEGVEVEFIPQSSPKFDYNQSQIAGLWISVSSDSGSMSRLIVEQILAYYRDRYII